MGVKGFRTHHLKICCFGILFILNGRHMNNNRCKKGTLTLTSNFSWKAGDETPMYKMPSQYQEERNSSTETGS